MPTRNQFLAALFAILFSAYTANCTHTLTVTQRDAVKSVMKAAILNWGTSTGTRNPLIPGAVRLAFHDCVGFCDGCINHDIGDNAGLRRYTDYIETYIYKAKITVTESNVETTYAISDILSRSDTWALTAIVALEVGIEEAGGDASVITDNVLFRYGRVDGCEDGTTDADNVLPDAQAGLEDTLKFMRSEFGFNSKETVALLGAHTLGWAAKNNSAFATQRWTARANELSNAFYTNLKDVAYNQRSYTTRKSGTKYFWSTETGTTTIDGFAMFHSDMCLYRDITIDEDSKQADCDLSTDCGLSSTAEYVEMFANSNSKWLSAFTAVFTKMIDHVENDLTEVSA